MFVARFKVYSAYVGSGVFGSVLAYSLARQGQGKLLNCEENKAFLLYCTSYEYFCTLEATCVSQRALSLVS